MNTIKRAIDVAGGITAFTRALNLHIEHPVTYQAVRKWLKRGRLPRTDWTGETNYSAAIEVLTGGAVTRDQLLLTQTGQPAPTNTPQAGVAA